MGPGPTNPIINPLCYGHLVLLNNVINFFVFFSSSELPSNHVSGKSRLRIFIWILHKGGVVTDFYLPTLNPSIFIKVGKNRCIPLKV
ncbi:MAG: hypothetical protein Ct9H300mP23_07380 [Nitrospinota bacterium]|nr:MAG: hypothetical protein Ct9H300mP23_07380 [Nitrospinota bacterium]